MACGQLFLQRFQRNAFGFRHVTLNVDPAQRTDNALQREAARRAQSGIQQREGVGQQEAGNP